MKITRSVKCSLKFANVGKLQQLRDILAEYGRVVNVFISRFWVDSPGKAGLLASRIEVQDTWLSARLRKVAAREALDMICAEKRRHGARAKRPTHRGKRMCLSSTIANLRLAGRGEFNAWLHLSSIGNRTILDLPIRFHQQWLKWMSRGRRLESYVVTEQAVQFAFEVETGPKLPPTDCVGVDTGINALATISTGEQVGVDIRACIDRIGRCQHGSNGHRQASRALRQRMSEAAKEVTTGVTLVVVENLRNITRNTRRRLGRETRRLIGRWNVRYWLSRLEMTCQERNVSFRTVSPRHTSQACHRCGHTDQRNRVGEVFLCRSCGHTDNADINAAKNILTRFLTGPYGAGCQPKMSQF